MAQHRRIPRSPRETRAGNAVPCQSVLRTLTDRLVTTSAAKAVRSLAPNGFMAFRLTLVGAVDFRSPMRLSTHEYDSSSVAGFAQTAWVAFGMSRRGTLAIRRDDRADAGRRTTRVASARSTRRRRHTAVCLSSSEDWSDCGLARVARESAPEPIDTRKKKESRASNDRTLSLMQCPTLFGLFGPAPHTRQPRLLFARQPDRPVVVLELYEPRI